MITLADAKDLGTIVFYVVSLFLAVLGFNKWRTELRGKSEYELAKKLLTAAYKTRDAISQCRSPMMVSGEWAERKPPEDEPEEEANVHNSWFAYARRYDAVYEATRDLQVLGLEAEAIWGSEAKEKVSALLMVAIKLRNTISLYHQFKIDALRHDRPEAQMMRAMSNILYGLDYTMAKSLNLNEDDPYLKDDNFRSSFDAAVSGVESYFKKHLK